ncbi:MAG: rhodanese-like domain-containing protein [Chthoniobacter sp.]|nr:rhodanese-like domain-containing protein [Chthoniobacter sp.]
MKSNTLAALGRDLLGLLIMATIALTAGVLINQFRVQPLPLVYASKAARLEQAVAKMEKQQAPEADAPDASPASGEVRELDLDEFRSLLAKPDALVLDARPEIFHRLGHVPGALALPRDDFEIFYQKQRQKLESYKNRTLLIYCQSSSCEDSHLVADALSHLGYTRLAVFTAGWNQWTQQHLPEEKE